MFLLIFRYVFGGALGASTGGISYVDFLVPGYVVTGVLFAGTAAAAGVAEDLQHGVVDRLRSLPISRTAVAAGRALAETLLVVWGAAVTTAIGFLVGFRPAGSLADSLIAFGLVVVFGFAFTWLFIVIGLFAGSAQAAQGMSLLVFPLTFVSSAYVPVETMPGWMQPIAQHQPITYMVDSVRALGHRGPRWRARPQRRLLHRPRPAVVGGAGRRVRPDRHLPLPEGVTARAAVAARSAVGDSQ